MRRLIQMATKNLVLAIPAFMAAGMAAGLSFDARPLKVLIIPFTFLMVYPMMVTLRPAEVLRGGDLKAQVLTQLLNFGVIPFLAFGLGRAFFPENPYLALGLLLAGLVPTSGMTISWTGFAKGNLAAAVKMTVIGLVLGSLATPVYVQGLLGAEIPVDLAAVFKQIGLIVFLPMAVGQLTRKLLVGRYGAAEFKQRIAPKFPALATLGVLGIVFIAMALKARSIAAHPEMLASILGPLSFLYGFNYLLSTLLGRLLLPRGDAVAMVYGSVMRNLSIALAIAMNAFGPQGSDAALVIALAYVLQVQSAAWYVKFSDRVLGPPESESAAVESA
ncbi:MAG: arsenite transporter [Desulfovibrionales bacterium]|nr:arsenite transporter [Desulfovibrionales bacterium]